MDLDRKDWALFPQEGYDSQDAKPKPAKEEPSLLRRRRRYEGEGMRRTVRAVLLVHVRGHPHVLALQGESGYVLPGGTLRPGESERDGLNRKMRQFIFNADAVSVCEWKMGDLLSIWWNPSFDGKSYPYLPQHVTRPKECAKVYQVTLPERCVFAVPQQDKLVAVPFFDLFDDPTVYGPQLRDIPQLASRFAISVFEPMSGKPQL
ncbi:unnamed protein product [Polarella glacialis]|uniref:Cleavage and polyadenylation specificity factor subunit 5 n=1 Tax=Polarella glacialis TaxID=89957 RepID=A0A813KME9_POLGL|nr:unnamed protein product [Polarella glacialis]